MLLCILSYHSLKKVVNIVYKSWVTLASSVFGNAVNYFIFKNSLRRVISFRIKYLRMKDLGTGIT